MFSIIWIFWLPLVLSQDFMADNFPPWWMTFGLQELEDVSYSPGMTTPCNTWTTLHPGMIVSFVNPDYPDYYPPLQLCRWLYQGSSEDVEVQLSCPEFDLEPEPSPGLCWLGDYLRINTGTGLGDFVTYCGDVGPVSVKSKWIEATFWSNVWNNDFDGFNCTVIAVATASVVPTIASTSSSLPPST